MTGRSLKLFRKTASKKLSEETESCKKSHVQVSAASKLKILDAVLENRSEAASSTDEETLESSSYINHGTLIAPIPRKAEVAYNPPNSIFVGVPTRSDGRYKYMKKILPWKRGYSSKRSSFSSSTQIHSPYISKTALNNLSPILRNSSQEVERSAWQSPTSLCSSTPVYYTPLQVETPPSVVEMNVPLSTSDSFTLPIVVSPAYKFVPIGCNESEEDDCDCTCSSEDYDICKPTSSDLDSMDKYSSNANDFGELNSLQEFKRDAPSCELRGTRSDPVCESRTIRHTIEDTIPVHDATPFEIDNTAANDNPLGNNVGIECTKVKSAYSIPKTRSSYSIDSINEEFSVVSLYEAEPTHSQSTDIDAVKEDKYEPNLNEMPSIWEQVSSLLTCGAQLNAVIS